MGVWGLLERGLRGHTDDEVWETGTMKGKLLSI